MRAGHDLREEAVGLGRVDDDLQVLRGAFEEEAAAAMRAVPREARAGGDGERRELEPAGARLTEEDERFGRRGPLGDDLEDKVAFQRAGGGWWSERQRSVRLDR
jgi:hypothetical protein